MLRAVTILLAFAFCTCGPHSHKNKENVEDGLFTPRDSNHYKDGSHKYEFDHESILGSHTAAEEFDGLPPAESKKRLHSLALKMDLNGDKYVDKEELIKWILKSFQMLTEEEAAEDLRDADVDEDGKVTWEEHIKEAYGLSDDEIGEQDMKKAEFLEMFQNELELFQVADLNKDGSLEKSEYPAFSHPEEFPHMHEIVYLQAMERRDKNKDGYLSFEEFIRDNDGISSSKDSEHYATERDRFVNDLDINGDEKLSKEEVLLWLIPNNEETAENEAFHLIDSSDDNKDGKLSIDEIVDHHEIFVGSEATEFGEQLQHIQKFEDEL